ncbi:hypothetical protein GSVR_21410 [Geobacter sp. SVR]|nr:hypothetical protein GSVR_21410 [Geobacter sp. SVR]
MVLRWGGRLAMVSAILTLPLFVISLQLDARGGRSILIAQLLMQISSTLIFVVLTGLLRSFLVRNCLFRGADRPLFFLILLNCVYAAFSSMALLDPQSKEQFQTVLMTLVVALGMLQALFGYLLRRMENDLGGFKRAFSSLNVFTGVCLASLVLIPVGVLASAVADVMLATIFFREVDRQGHLPEDSPEP